MRPKAGPPVNWTDSVIEQRLSNDDDSTRKYRLKNNWKERLPVIVEEDDHDDHRNIDHRPSQQEPNNSHLLESNRYHRLWFYLLSTIIGGLICDIRPRWIWPFLKRWFKYSTPNPYHLFLVKSHWLPVNIFLHFALTAASGVIIIPLEKRFYLKRLIRLKLIRLAAFYFCYEFTQIAFDWFLEHTEQITATCHHRSNGIDISGHVFVLVLSNLFLINETELIEQFLYHPKSISIIEKTTEFDEVEIPRRARPKFVDKDPVVMVSKRKPFPSPEIVSDRRSIWWWAVAGVHLISRTISLAWDIFLLQTQFFYHTTGEKLVAFLIAVVCVNFISKLPVKIS